MPFEYQVGGSLSADSPSYVYRQADHQFYDYLRTGKFCYVLNSRQMGKSSLRVQAIQRLKADGFACIFVDLTGMGRQGFTPEKWYAGFVQALVVGSPLRTLPWRDWWREQRALLTPCQCLGAFIEEVLCPAIGKPLIIFVDEIDRVLSQSFSLDDFFGLIRYFSEKKADAPHLYPLTFALLGVASPTELIQDRAKSPFNIGKAIALSGFQFKEAQPLITGLESVVDHPEAVLQEILDWTHGQPFLTQKFCQLVVNAAQEDREISVESVVQSRILDSWECQDEPEHLRTIRDRILRNHHIAVACLESYAQILTNGATPAEHSQVEQYLKLAGLAIEVGGQIQPHNRVYQAIFDREWVSEQLAEIRPYSIRLEHWYRAGQPADQHLLVNMELDEALTWAAERQLSDRDYQFLVASQQQAKQAAQDSLEVNRTANQLLQAAHNKAEALAAQSRFPWRGLAWIAGGVTCALMGLKSLGVLQGLELGLYDLGLRWNPNKYRDERVVIVTIDDQDIQQLGTWPMSDQTLTETLKILQASGVNSIGIDLFRDVPIEPGHQQLTQEFQQSSNLFGIEKIVGNSILPPPALNSEQVGFADQVIDPDQRIRRALLSVDYKGLAYSLGAQMALYYLQGKDIELQPVGDDGSRVKLGQAMFHRFDKNDGGYQRVDDGGFQIVLNWNRGKFDQISLQQVLNNEAPRGGWRDRIVLIGVTSVGEKDYFYTPFSSRPFQAPEQMAGVDIIGQTVSQLVGAALGERSLMIPCSPILAWFWTGGWAVLGAVIGGQILRLSRRVGLTAVGIVALGGSFFLLLWCGFWITGASGVLAFVGTELCVMGLNHRRRQLYRNQQVSDQLTSMITDHPHAGRLALSHWQETKQENSTSQN